MREDTKRTSLELLESYKSILEFYFGDISEDTLKKLSTNQSESFELEDIYSISKELSLEVQNLEFDIKDLQAYMLPAIFYNDKGEAIVLMSIDGDVATIKQGFIQNLKESSLEYIGKKFDKALFFASKQSQIKSLDIGDKKDKGWFFNPIKKEYKAYIEVAILTIFINIFGLAIPLFTMSVYNRVIPNFAVDTLFVLAVGVVVLLVFDFILKSARMHILEDVVKRLSNYFEEELFKKSLTIQSKYDNYLVGTKTNLFKELHVVKDFFATKLIHLLDVPYFFTAMIVIALIDPVMVLVPLIAATLMLGFNFIMQYPISSLHKKSFKESQSKQGYLVEQLQGIEAIKLSNALNMRVHKYRRIINFHHHINGKIQLLNGISSSMSALVLQAVSVFSVVVGVYSIHNGNLNVGGLIAITILSSRAMVPIVNLSNIMIKYKQVKEALESLNNYWHIPTETQKYNEIGLGKVKGDVAFDRVSFTYPNSEVASISDITFSIKAGQRVGIIGQTGAGKSTIQKLLTGILSPDSGKIYIDNMDLSTLHPVELRQNIALMPQEPYLFSGTLKENLELERRISKKRMSDVLKLTGLDELLNKNLTVDTVDVGERGSYLSVGQRHLVGLARAMMSDAPVMILDEPTTGLDVGLEKRVVKSLDKELAGKTLIVITHRFAALELVDRVIVVNGGKIVADGPKKEILEMLNGKKAVDNV